MTTTYGLFGSIEMLALCQRVLGLWPLPFNCDRPSVALVPRILPDLAYPFPSSSSLIMKSSDTGKQLARVDS